MRTIRSAVRTEELRYPANWLSLFRLVLVVPTIKLLLRPGGERKALIVIGVAMATDAIDGPLARARGEISDLGKVLDPIADKLTLDTVALAMSARHELPWWITYLLLGRDAAIVTGSTLMFRRSARITPSIVAGKATTVSLTGALLLYMLDVQPWGRRLLHLSLIPLGISWVQYGALYWQWLKERSYAGRRGA